jgi:hypothetical protein
MRLARGERTGLLGSKRKNQLDAHGFSPKNFSHLFRLAECGRQFFRTGEYPVVIKNSNPEVHDLCMSVKLNPEQWDKEELTEKALLMKQRMEEAYAEMPEANKYVPDYEYVGKVLQHFYSTI